MPRVYPAAKMIPRRAFAPVAHRFEGRKGPVTLVYDTPAQRRTIKSRHTRRSRRWLARELAEMGEEVARANDPADGVSPSPDPS